MARGAAFGPSFTQMFTLLALLDADGLEEFNEVLEGKEVRGTG